MIEISQKIRIIVIITCIAFWLFGCGTSKFAENNELVIENQTPIVVEKTGDDDRPDWTSEKPFFENDSGLYISGGFLSGTDYALTLRLAKSEAMKNLLESIKLRAQGEFSSAIHGQNANENDIGRYVTDAVAWTIDNLNVRGIRQHNTYYEKIYDPISQSFKYNAWVQLEISKTDYLRAKTEAAQNLLNRAVREKDQEAKEKALELLHKLRQEA